MAPNIEEQFSLFAADSHASRSARPGTSEAQTMTAISGQKCLESYARYSQLGLLAKTLLESSIWNSTKCFLTWKVRVTPAKRLIFRLAESMPTTYAIASGLLPTATATEYGSNKSPSKGAAVRPSLSQMARRDMWPTMTVTTAEHPGRVKLKPGQQTTLSQEVNREILPTPDVGAAKGRGEKSSDNRSRLGGSLNPEWIEWLQGFPVGWTDLED